MKLLPRTLLVLLIVLLILTVLWLSLPRLITGLVHSQLSQQGYRDVELVIGSIGFHSARIEQLRMANGDYSVKLQGLKSEYSVSSLLSGAVDSIELELAELTRLENNKGGSSLPDPILLLALLRSPWHEYMRARSLHVKMFSLLDNKGTRLLSSSFEINKMDSDISGNFRFMDDNEETHRVSLEVSEEKGFILQQRSETAAESVASPLSVSLKAADDMNGLSGQINIDLSKLQWLPQGLDKLSGHLQAEISYLGRAGETKKDFSVLADITAMQYENWQLQSSSINIRGSIEGVDGVYSVKFSQPSSILMQSVRQDNNRIEKINLDLPGSLKIATGKILIDENSGAVISIRKLVLDDIDIAEMQIKNIDLRAESSVEDQAVCHYKMHLSALQIKRQGLDIKTLPVRLSGVCTDSENAGWSLNAETESLTIEDDDFLLPMQLCKAQIKAAAEKNVASKNPSAQSPTDLRGRFSCESSRQSAAVLSSFQLNPESGSGRVKFSTSGIKPTTELPLFASLLKNWIEPYDLVSGELSLNGNYRWWKNLKGNDRENLLMNLNIKDGGGYYGSVLFSGLNYSDKIETLPFVKSSAFSDIAIRNIDVGIPINSNRASIRFSRSKKGSLPVMTVNSLSASVLDGTVLGNDLKIDLNNAEHDLILVVEGLDVSKIVELQQLEGLSATG